MVQIKFFRDTVHLQLVLQTLKIMPTRVPKTRVIRVPTQVYNKVHTNMVQIHFEHTLHETLIIISKIKKTAALKNNFSLEQYIVIKCICAS